MDLNTIIRGCCEGSQNAWKKFIKEFHKLISGTVYKTCPYESEDIIQSIYEKLIKDQYKLLAQFNGCYEQFLIYLKNISYNTALDYLKKINRYNDNSVDLDMFLEGIADDHANIESTFLLEYELTLLYQAISELKHDSQEIMLFLAKGYKYKDIALMMNLPLNTVLTKANRAKKILKKILINEIKSSSKEIYI